ncbi:MAG TPA: hypothetical protein HA226_03290 [Nanoarchaeota archaeon]|nr:hypothetical protein [Nanoarchaeota archaeon]
MEIFCLKCETSNDVMVQRRDVDYKLLGGVLDYFICHKCNTQHSLEWINGFPKNLKIAKE